MTQRQLDLLKQLVLCPSPSGFEKEIAGLIQKQIPNGNRNVGVDFQNNVLVTIPGKTNNRVMIDAHLDQVGFIISNIDEHGQISLLSIGGIDSSIMSNKNLVILTEGGPVNAVVNRKAAHLVEYESDESIDHTYEALVDIGIRGFKKVSKVVQVGDPVVYKPTFEHLYDQYYTGNGLDNKVGCFVLIETIRNIVHLSERPFHTLVFTFSSQEETNGRKCRPLIKRFKPSIFIEVDVTFATDWDEKSFDSEKQVGRCVLGKGPVLYRGVDIDRDCFALLKKGAKKAGTAVQVQASTGDIGYTATEVTNESHGVRGMIVGLPLRNMHSSVEIVNTKDLTDAVKLLTKSLLTKSLI